MPWRSVPRSNPADRPPPSASSNMTGPFERGAVVVSIDTEQIWGYCDYLNEEQFESRFPNARSTHARLLARLCEARVCATWFVVGALALRDCDGASDRR